MSSTSTTKHTNMKSKILLLLLVAFSISATAQESIGERDENLQQMNKKGWELELKAGLNIGGATPLGLPREIRHINSFDPKLNGTLECAVTKWFGRWGVASGLRLEAKRMSTGATVKNYHTAIIQNGDQVAGYFTGYDKTDYNSNDLTLPITANYRVNPRWKVRGGMFFSYCLSRQFNGYVSDGYLRNGTPTGEKVTFDNGSSAIYNFDDNLRRFNWGAQVGFSWNAYKHFSLFSDLTYSFNNIFKSDFHTVAFTMHPIYLNAGFGYRF